MDNVINMSVGTNENVSEYLDGEITLSQLYDLEKVYVDQLPETYEDCKKIHINF